MKKAKGFTLIEVLIALTVFALAGTAVLSIASTSVNGTARIEAQTLATWVAANQLVETNLQAQWPPTKKTGRAEMAGHEWHWQRIVEATEDKNMRAVTVEVRLEQSDKYPLASLITYVSNPKARQ
ncbi:type II secretion system minor pseudopilin GspI [Thalassotalea ponticola]|uniref:type II secretion system minor pseudopilin GspI n=1 Tax=Thalassotalea ponticola TaxID=1523392 RepID=UPI0025B59542|nr:type II secretion system minor pseudopilin GspI [Thalassotalea ponticola]MDN3653000.1 type II secretion system minor pseudopilin GspI [Thalassotalea ponticola]